MREFPEILACARDVESLCPEAWLINYINPTTVHGIGLRRYAPGVKSFALCDSLHMPHVKRGSALLARIIDGPEEYTEEVADQFDLRIAGANHFTWVLRAAYQGTDVTPAIAESVRQRAAAETDEEGVGAKARFNASIARALYEILGYLPACIAHTKEYVRYWQGRGVLPEAIPPLSIWETGPRYQRTEAMWEEIDDYLSGETAISEFVERHGPDHATDIIESMVGDLGKPFYINTFNEGAVSNMSDDAFLELLCEIDMNGPRPVAVGEMPRGLRGLQEQVLDTHELTAQAIVDCDRALLRRALLTDPLSSSIADGDAIIRELLAAERDALPECWFT
jgi:alpha-galactosidase